MNELDKLLNRIPGSGLLISSLPGSAKEWMLNQSASLAMSTSVFEALPGKLDIKRHSPSILYLFGSIYSKNPCVLPLFVPVGGHPAWRKSSLKYYQDPFFLSTHVNYRNKSNELLFQKNIAAIRFLSNKHNVFNINLRTLLINIYFFQI